MKKSIVLATEAAWQGERVCNDGTAEDTSRRLVSRVDENLFCHKTVARDAGSKLAGALVDVGAVELCGH